MPYVAEKPNPVNVDELRRRIPGWGADLDPADRPSFPKEQYDPQATGAHWDFPERQPDGMNRERSNEHEMLTPVFGTAQPLHGVSGAVRRVAYKRFSEARAAHWLLLMLGDRIETLGSHAKSFASLHPDNPITETGVLGEFRRKPISSRWRRGRADTKHMWLDPVIVAGPWILASWLIVRAFRRRR